MAIGTYSELKTALTNFSQRSDLTSYHDDFIALCEEAIYNGLGPAQPLRITGMQETATSGLPTLPDGFLEAIRLTVSDGASTYNVEYLPPDLFATRPTEVGGTTKHYTIIDSQLDTVPSIAALTYRLDYYKRFSALSGSATTNYILTNAPGVYLFGCLMFLYKMTRDAQGEASAMRDFAAGMNALQRKDRNLRQRGSALMVRSV